MKIINTLVIILLFQLPATAQSPYLSVKLFMDSILSGSTRYKIEMKICEPVKKTGRGSWFSHDTSAIDFVKLPSAATSCGEYFWKGEPDRISGGDNDPVLNRFTFSNQVFAWEKILVFKISNVSSRGWWPEMYIVMPMHYKAFVTYIRLNDIEFQSGQVFFLDHPEAAYEGSSLMIKPSLKNRKGVEMREFLQKEIL